MNRVAPRRRAIWRSPWTSSRSRLKVCRFPSVVATSGRSRATGRSRLGGKPASWPRAVGDLRLEPLAGKEPALPGDEVGVLDRQFGEARRLADRQGAVGLGDLVEQDVARPTVGHDVVQGQAEGVLVRLEVEQQGPPERPALEIERAPGGAVEQAAPLGAAQLRRQGGQVGPGQQERAIAVEALHRRAVDRRDAGGEDLVARERQLHRGEEDPGVERPAQPDRRGDVVAPALRLQLMEEPEPLLGPGERLVTLPGGALDGERRRAVAATDQGVQPAGQLLDRRVLEQLAHRGVHGERPAHPRHQLGGEERVAAQVEEVVARADPGRRPVEELRPEPGQDLLDRRGPGRRVPPRARRVERCGRGSLRRRLGAATALEIRQLAPLPLGEEAELARP